MVRKIMIVEKIKYIFIISSLVIFCISFACFEAFSNEEKVKTNSSVITLEFDNRSFGDVVRELSKQIGYKIIIDTEWVDMPVSGHYEEVDVDSFFRRVLKGQNISVLYDSNQKEIIVRSFGSKVFHAFVPGSGEDDAVDQITGIKLSEIKKLREKEAKEIQEYYADPNSIDQMSGMTLGEIAHLREQEEKVKHEYYSNPESVEQMSGETLDEIAQLREKEEKEKQDYYSNPGSVDQMTGKTLGEINSLRESEAQTIKEYYSNPDSIDQMSGMTLGEIANLREQEKKFSKK